MCNLDPEKSAHLEERDHAHSQTRINSGVENTKIAECSHQCAHIALVRPLQEL